MGWYENERVWAGGEKPCSKEQGDHHFSANCQAPWRFLAVEPNGSAALSCDSGSTARPLDAVTGTEVAKGKSDAGLTCPTPKSGLGREATNQASPKGSAFIGNGQ